jgi:hypothetical protein
LRPTAAPTHRFDMVSIASGKGQPILVLGSSAFYRTSRGVTTNSN